MLYWSIKHIINWLQVLGWFATESSRLVLCRVKKKFARTSCIDDGYRDLSLSIVFSDSSGLRLIGEVQIHDREMHELKLQVGLQQCFCYKFSIILWLVKIHYPVSF
jgi:hypothetical protein